MDGSQGELFGAGPLEPVAVRREGSRPALVLSGGAASEIAPHLAMAHEVRENLVLEGLVRLAEAG